MIMQNDEVIKKLLDIQHVEAPTGSNQFAYALGFDQNMLNSILGHFGVIKEQIMVRKLIQMYDKKGSILNMMHTQLLQIALPTLTSDYGKRFFDVSFSLD